MWGKGQFLDASARVPLIVRYPERFDPSVVDANVNLCDLYATICDLVDVPVPGGRDSRSLVPLMEGKADEWSDETISQGVRNGSVAGGVKSSELMIKHGDLKYCYFGEEYDELLFDLDRNSDETTDFADDPDYEAAMERFRERRTELGYGPDAGSEYVDAGYL